ncbi:MAG: TetR family transcriptional regulator [Anaerolineaceae bacterium]|nr:TetR family transcriptional regulator [Anaerolineaceae bacterium]
MTRQKGKVTDLREACIQEALKIIEVSGIEELSLREISRRLGVSHQAPYKHFPSREHILAEIVSRAFNSFAQYLDDRPHSDNPLANLESMGRAYLNYALMHPLQYRLMFGTPLPDPTQHPEMMKSAQHAFALLRSCIAQTNLNIDEVDGSGKVSLDALFVWSTIHGLASILQTRALDTLSLPDEILDSAVDHTLFRIDKALNIKKSN